MIPGPYFSPWLRDKIWEWPGNEANFIPHCSDMSSLHVTTMHWFCMEHKCVSCQRLRTISLRGPLLRTISLRGPLLRTISLRGPPLRTISLREPPLRTISLRGPPLRTISLRGPPLRTISLRALLPGDWEVKGTRSASKMLQIEQVRW